MGDCQFCDLINGQDSDRVLAWTDDRFAVLMGRYQPTGPGYALVIPRLHVVDLHELPDDLIAPLLTMVRRVSLAVRDTFGATGTTIMQNNGRPAQSVFHLHVHVVPRHMGDGYGGGAGDEVPTDELQRQGTLLAAALEEG